MFVLSTKLKRLKMKLKVWNKEVFANVHNLVSEPEKDLSEIQVQIQTSGHSDVLMNDEKQAKMKLNDALLKQEVF